MPAAVMLAQLADDLCQKRHEVTVYTTFPSLPQGRVFEGYTRRLWTTSRHGRLRVIRCFSFTIGERRTRVWRGLSHFSFGLMSALRLLLEDKPDVIVAEMAPVISSPFIILAAKLLRVPVANYIQDLFPEAMESAGMIRQGGIMARVALWVDRMTCLRSDVNIVISESFIDALVRTRRVPAERIELIRSWVDGSNIKPTSRDNSWRRGMDIPEKKFVAMFAGTLGLASGADILVQVAEELSKRKKDEILLVIIGEGLLKKTMVQEAERMRLANVLFFPFQPADRLAEVQSTADVMLLPVKGDHGFSSVPSKLVTYMAVGRPVLCAASGASSVAALITRADCGWIVSSDDPVAIAESLIEISENKQGCQTKGENARSFFEKHLDLPDAMDSFERLFSNFSGNGSRRGAIS